MTEWNLSAKCKGLRPLAVDSSGLLCHARGALYRVGYDLKQPFFICNFPGIGLTGHLDGKFRLVDRILRLGPSHAVVVDDALFISRRSEIWRCDLITGQLSLDFVIPDGRRALEFGRIERADGEVQIVFGEYFYNPSLAAVRIWGRSNRNPNWAVLGEFSHGEIDHVHAVTAIGEQVFLLCGDFGHGASIWTSDLDFSSITPLLRGSQAYRATWITEFGGRFFYATDTQLEANHVYELCINDHIAKISELAKIEGSSIYSGRGEDYQFFSTTVECGMPTGNFLRDMLDTRRGPGILSSKAKIMGIGADGVCEEIFVAEKDALPFRLAQFGTFTFPSGKMPPDTVIAYGTALRGVDDTCMVFVK